MNTSRGIGKYLTETIDSYRWKDLSSHLHPNLFQGKPCFSSVSRTHKICWNIYFMYAELWSYGFKESSDRLSKGIKCILVLVHIVIYLLTFFVQRIPLPYIKNSKPARVKACTVDIIRFSWQQQVQLTAKSLGMAQPLPPGSLPGMTRATFWPYDGDRRNEDSQ